MAYHTLRCYLSAIAFYTKSRYNRDPTKSHAMKLLLKSYNNSELGDTDIRKPIDITMLTDLSNNALASNIDLYDRYAFIIMYNFMFHAALRVSEICKSNTSKHILQFKHVHFDQGKSLVTLKLTSFKQKWSFHKHRYFLQQTFKESDKEISIHEGPATGPFHLSQKS